MSTPCESQRAQPWPLLRPLMLAMAAALALAGCSSGSGSGTPSTGTVSVSVSAAADRVLTRHQVQLTATVTGSSDASVTWSASAGSVSSSGLFTAPDAPGSVTVKATSVADQSRSASATIDVRQLAISAASAQADVLTGHQVQLTATVTGWSETGVTWSATAGNVDASGLFTAPVDPGLVTVTATSVACTECTATAQVQVHQVVVSLPPDQGRVLSGENRQFTATVTGWSDTSVTWSATAGSIDEHTGLFTAPGEDQLGPVQVTATSVADPSRSATATITVFEIPIVTVTAENPIDSTDHTEVGTIQVDPRDGSAVFGPVPMAIKGRGNTTWGMPKKPYKVKLDSKASLLGMPADKEWVLLANFVDKSMVRTSLAMELSRRLGLPWAPRFRYVEVYLGIGSDTPTYQGTYQLGEQIKVAPARVNITEMGTGDISGDAVTGGYLLEIDQRKGDVGDTVLQTTQADWTWDGTVVPHYFVAKSPKKPTTEQAAWIQTYLQTAEDALFGPDFADPVKGYQAYWDVDTLVNWYLVQELAKNVDGNFFSSVYVSKDRLGKLRLGPVWDFDIGFGNPNYRTPDDADAYSAPENWYIRVQQPAWIPVGKSYYARLFQDPAFVALVEARWQAVKASELDTISDFIDETAATLEHAEVNNYALWPQALTWCDWPNVPTCTGDPTTFDGDVQFVKEFLQDRIAWMDANF